MSTSMIPSSLSNVRNKSSSFELVRSILGDVEECILLDDVVNAVVRFLLVAVPVLVILGGWFLRDYWKLKKALGQKDVRSSYQLEIARGLEKLANFAADINKAQQDGVTKLQYDFSVYLMLSGSSVQILTSHTKQSFADLAGNGPNLSETVLDESVDESLHLPVLKSGGKALGSFAARTPRDSIVVAKNRIVKKVRS